MAINHTLLAFLLLLAASSISAAVASSPGWPWVEQPNVKADRRFFASAQFALSEHNKQTKEQLQLVQLLEGRVWSMKLLRATHHQFVIQARTKSNLLKIYKCSVGYWAISRKPTLEWFEAVLA